jgi:hypothetical protein
MLILRQPCLKQLNREQDWSYLRSGVGAVMENMLHHIDDQNLVCFVFAQTCSVACSQAVSSKLTGNL